MRPILFSVLSAALVAGSAWAASPATDFPSASAQRFADLALTCVHKEYPNKIAHVLTGDGDVKPPRELTPVFFGCYDWHSAVHGHWLLARLARTYPEAPFAVPARRIFATSFSPEAVAAELAYLEGAGRVSFERPYGLAWLLQLASELAQWPEPGAQEWSKALEPLEQAAARRFRDWLPKLSRPIRGGEHDQTAFAFGLVADWAKIRNDPAMTRLLESRVRELYLADRSCPLSYEPGGQDFLSPCLGEADLIRRFFPPAEFARWLKEFLPDLPKNGSAAWLVPAVVTDPTDPKLAHLDGLNLSRAWMLEGIASGLPEDDRRRAALLAAAREHRARGLAAVTGEHYEGGHWLGSFAVYLVTGRGVEIR